MNCVLTLILLFANLSLLNANVKFLDLSSNTTRLKRQSNCDGFQCASGECISDELQCDGAINCKDGSDETFSCRNIPCQPFLFRCNYGACINGDYECDGKTDCKDNSDETTVKCSRITPPPTNDCGTNMFACKSGQCIDELDLCDGIVNCKDGSDETREACFKIDCPAYTYKCAYGGCVDGGARCNGNKDCIDNSDEEGCVDVPKPIPTPKPTTTTTTAATIQVGACILPEVLNGYVTVQGNPLSPYTTGSEVPPYTQIKYTCKVGHALVGTENLNYCIGGKWIPEIPRCEKICQAILTSNVLDARCYKGETKVDCSKPFSGTRAKLSCAPLYEDLSLKQYPYRICRDGTWDRNLPNCVPECGMKFVNAQPLIIGGVKAKKDHWPWVVGVYKKNDKKHICGGSLLNQKVILSAAHCFTDEFARPLPPEGYVIGAGKHYRIFDHPGDSKSAQYSDVAHVFVPSDYLGDTQNFRADIAVVVVIEAFILSNNVRPVCVDWGPTFEVEQLKSGTNGVVLGWGLTSEGGEASDELKELEVPYYHTAECTERLPVNFRRFATTGDKICGGYFNQSTAVCEGDSGGGYSFPKGDRYYIRGVVSVSPSSPTSNQRTCDSNQYTLYTRISKYDEFIAEYETNYRPLTT